MRYAFLLACARCGRFTLQTVAVSAGENFYLPTRCANLERVGPSDQFGRAPEACNWVLISQPAEGAPA